LLLEKCDLPCFHLVGPNFALGNVATRLFLACLPRSSPRRPASRFDGWRRLSAGGWCFPKLAFEWLLDFVMCLCLPPVSWNSELGSVAISHLRDRACFGGQGLFFAFWGLESGGPLCWHRWSPPDSQDRSRSSGLWTPMASIGAVSVSELRVVI